MKNPFNFEAEPFEAYSEFDEYEGEQLDAYSEFGEEYESDFEAEPFETYPEFEESDELLEEHEEEEFRVSDLPNKVREAFGMGPLAWPLVVQRAIEAGIRDSGELANIVFFLHHPERRGRALNSSEPNFKKFSEEWKAWRTLIEPMLKKTSGVPAPPILGPTIGPKPTLPFTPVPVESPGGGRIKDKREPRQGDLVTVIGYKGRKVSLHRLAAQALEVMIQAARGDGIPKPLLELVSGYRSVAHQEKLWKIGLKKHGSAEEARKWIAPPGHSAHHSGRAVDLWMGLGIGKRNASAMRKGIAYKWMVNNAVRFGFYPYEAEPWHWEYNPPAAGQSEVYPESYVALELWNDYEDEGVDMYWESDEAFESGDQYEDEGVDVYSEFDEETGFFDSEVKKEKYVEDRCTSDYIRWVQSSLNRIMGLRLKVNGIPGKLTRSAIRSFQKRRGLKPDGFVGPQTERALIAAGASPSPSVRRLPRRATALRELVPLLNKYLGDIPLDFLLGWVEKESGRQIGSLTNLCERGYFQNHPEESMTLSLDHDRLSTDPEYSVKGGIELVKRYKKRVEKLSESFGFAKEGDLFWGIVKLLHWLPKGVNVILKDIRQHGFKATTWSEFKQYVERRQEELRRLIGAKPGSGWDPITGIRNADFVLKKGKELVKQLANL